MSGGRTLSDAKRRVAEHLKGHGPSTASELAMCLDLTPSAVRQHTAVLEATGLVEQQAQRARGRGRPAVRWALTDLAAGLFPDRHADLTVGLIQATRRAVGEKGLQRVIDARSEDQLAAYRRVLPPRRESLGRRVEALARLRTAEGYMAEVVPDGRGTWLLVENHCPVCDAARACLGLCRSELDVFQRVLGDDVVVERIQHLLSGGERCVYRISRPQRAG